MRFCTVKLDALGDQTLGCLLGTRCAHLSHSCYSFCHGDYYLCTIKISFDGESIAGIGGEIYIKSKTPQKAEFGELLCGKGFK